MIRLRYTVLSAALMLSLPAVAQIVPAAKPNTPQPNTIDMTTVLEADGKPIDNKLDDPACKTNCVKLTLGHVVAYALRVSTLIDPELVGAQGRPASASSAVDKALRERLAQQIADDKAAVLSAHDIDTIKKALSLAPLSGVVMLDVLPVIDPGGWKSAVEAESKK